MDGEVKYKVGGRKFQLGTIVRDNHAEGMVFRKRFYTKENFRGGERPSKSVLKTYLRNLEKNIFCSEIYDFVIKIS